MGDRQICYVERAWILDIELINGYWKWHKSKRGGEKGRQRMRKERGEREEERGKGERREVVATCSEEG